MKFTIGTDPEFMLRKDGEYASSIGLLRYTKRVPKRFPDGTTLQKDNVAIEFASSVADSEETFVKAVRTAFFHTLSEIPSEYGLVATPSAHFKVELLESKEAQEIGCEPDFNAWTSQKNVAPVEEFRAGTLRSCGAHIHVGHPSLRKIFDKEDMIKVMDYVVGNTTVPLDCDAPALERRKLYGKAGCFRPTNYGVEYRTLSNFWLKTPNLVRLIYNLTADSLKVMTDDGIGALIQHCEPEHIHSAINTGDNRQAMKNLQKLNGFLSKKSKQLFGRCMRYTPKALREEWDL